MGLLRYLSNARLAVPGTAALLLIVFAAFCYRAADDTSATFDEPVHMLAGYSYWTKGSPETTTGNLRAAQLWLSLPLLSLPVHYPEAYRNVPGLVGDARLDVARDFIHDARHDPAAMLRLSRAAITVLGVALGAVLFLWARRLHGDAAALVTLALYCGEPTVIAHSSLATTDIAATLMFTLALAAWWRLLHAPDWMAVGLCGLATGLLATTKISAPLIAPAVGVMLGVRFVWRQERPWGGFGAGAAAPSVRALVAASLGALLIAYAILWAVYGFRFAPGRVLPESTWISLLVPQATRVQRLLNFCRLHHLLPEAYLYDLNSFLNNLEGRRAYLLGRHSVEGWGIYFPVAWLAKTSLATLVAVGLALVAGGLTLVRRRWNGRMLYPLVPLGAFAVIYVISALRSPLNIGLRHLLPVYPALFILAGLSVRLLADSIPSSRRLLVAGLGLGSLATAWAASPHFLGYFNPAAGGPANGHRILVDSNFDWGQDLPKIARWLKDPSVNLAGPDRSIFFAYFGLGDPARYGISATMLPQEPDFRPTAIYELKAGTYVISATILQALGGRWVWGPWRPSLERAYRALDAELDPLFARAREGNADPEPWSEELRQKIGLHDELRLARLCAYLRLRQPAARITPAILVFSLTTEDLAAALKGPPLFAAEPTIKGLSRLPADSINFLR